MSCICCSNTSVSLQRPKILSDLASTAWMAWRIILVLASSWFTFQPHSTAFPLLPLPKERVLHLGPFVSCKIEDFSSILVSRFCYSVCLSVSLSLCLSVAYRPQFETDLHEISPHGRVCHKEEAFCFWGQKVNIGQRSTTLVVFLKSSIFIWLTWNLKRIYI